MESLLGKVDRASRWRILTPIIFFVRRWIMAVFLVLSTFYYLGAAAQYVIVVILSAINIIYMMI